MASIKLAGDTSGEITISAPAVAGTNTLTLPASSGTIVTDTGAQTIQFSAGTAAAPSITTTGDTNTGMFFPAADTIAFAEGGAEAMRIDSSGNVGIGTTAPAGILDVSQSTAGVARHYLRNTNGGTGSYTILDLVNDTGSIISEFFCTSSTNTSGFGANATVLQAATSNPLILGTNGIERMRIDGGTGSVRIGSNNAYGLNEKLMIYGSSTANQPTIISSKEASGTVSSNHFLFQNTNGTVGSVATSGSATSYNTSSDYRLKENVSPMSGSIDRLKQLKPSTWTWTQDGSHGEGFLAHEAQEVVPESVHGTKDAMRTEEYEVTPAVLDDDGNVVTEAVMGTREVPDYQGIDQSKLVPLLTAALQEAITKIEDLETRIQALEAK